MKADDELSPLARQILDGVWTRLEAQGALLDARGSKSLKFPTGLDESAFVYSVPPQPTVADGQTTYDSLIELWRKYTVTPEPQFAAGPWRVIEASAGTLPPGVAMAVASPLGMHCVLNGCKHTHVVLLTEPGTPHPGVMKEPEVHKVVKSRPWSRHRWTVILPDSSIRRTRTRWGADRVVRKATKGRHRKP